MKTLIAMAVLVLFTTSISAQQDQKQFQQRLNTIVQPGPQPPREIQTKNLQLELTIARAGKTARYLMTFNGGQIQTDLLDKLADPSTNAEPKFISFSATFTPFEDNGGELALFIGRTMNYRAGSRTENGVQRDIVTPWGV